MNTADASPNRKHEILVSTINPYEALFQNRNVVTRETLMLTKWLKSQGHNVIFGDGQSEINYVAEYSHTAELLPILLDFVSMVSAHVIGAGIFEYLKFRRENLSANVAREVPIILRATDGDVAKYLDTTGRPMSPDDVQALRRRLLEKKRAFDEAISGRPLDRSNYLPAFLGHKTHVGWLRVAHNDHGVYIDSSDLTPEGYQAVQDGTVKSYSLGILVREATCSICQNSFIDCPHGWWEFRRTNETAVVSITCADVAEVSLVAEAAFPGTDILLVKS